MLRIPRFNCTSWCWIGSLYLGWHPVARELRFSLDLLCFDIRVSSIPLSMCLMYSHDDHCTQTILWSNESLWSILLVVYPFCLMYFFTYCLCHYPYHDLMVQVISGRWSTRVLATLPLTSLFHRMPVLGQQPCLLFHIYIYYSAAKVYVSKYWTKFVIIYIQST
jgi:hypothetical protein